MDIYDAALPTAAMADLFRKADEIEQKRRAKIHTVHLIRAGMGFWKWHCSCGRESRQRFGFPGLAEQAGIAHCKAMNGTAS